MVKKALDGDLSIGGSQLQSFVAKLTDLERANCLLFLEGKIDELTALDGLATLDAINLTTQMIDRLPTNEPNAGACLQYDESLHGGVERSLVPKMETFSGRVKEGHKFIETFKLQTVNMDDSRRIASFRALSGVVVSSWFKNRRYDHWEDLERDFREDWCIKMTASAAMDKVGKLYHEEHHDIRGYVVKFEEYRYFFKHAVVTSVQIELFMKNVRPSLQRHYIELKAKNLSWRDFISEITHLDKEEVRVTQKGSRKNVVYHTGEDQDDSPSGSQGGGLAKEVRELKKRLAQFEGEKKSSGRPGSSGEGKSKKKKRKFDISKSRCHNCGELGHFSRACTNPAKGSKESSSKKSSGKVKQD
jgi:CRISPR/Cas system endoribonuclease Cas6 (RAMP superfamily)